MSNAQMSISKMSLLGVLPLRGLFAIAGIALLSAAVGLAAAPSADAARSQASAIRINVANVNFFDVVQVDAVHRDIIRAAHRVCGASRYSPVTSRSDRRCVEQAVDSAVRNAGIATLTALHAGVTDKERYRSWRGAPTDDMVRMVAEAAGVDGNAGQIAQPEDPLPQ